MHLPLQAVSIAVCDTVFSLAVRRLWGSSLCLLSSMSQKQMLRPCSMTCHFDCTSLLLQYVNLVGAVGHRAMVCSQGRRAYLTCKLSEGSTGSCRHVCIASRCACSISWMPVCRCQYAGELINASLARVNMAAMTRHLGP